MEFVKGLVGAFRSGKSVAKLKERYHWPGYYNEV